MMKVPQQSTMVQHTKSHPHWEEEQESETDQESAVSSPMALPLVPSQLLVLNLIWNAVQIVLNMGLMVQIK